jgi:hypothetical protein
LTKYILINIDVFNNYVRRVRQQLTKQDTNYVDFTKMKTLSEFSLITLLNVKDFLKKLDKSTIEGVIGTYKLSIYFALIVKFLGIKNNKKFYLNFLDIFFTEYLKVLTGISTYNQAIEYLSKIVNLPKKYFLIFDKVTSLFEEQLFSLDFDSDAEVLEFLYERLKLLFENIKNWGEVLNEEDVIKFLKGEIDGEYFNKKLKQYEEDKKIKIYFSISQIDYNKRDKLLKFIHLY